jgi:cysteine desulfurase/selenocysteine lyase
MEHHSNIIPWENLSALLGFKVKYAEIDEDASVDYDKLIDMFTSKTRMVCISHVSNVTGIINDIEAVANVAHDHGALVLVDAAQSVPHLPVNVKQLDVDFLAFSGHKMLGPTGIGGLYAKRHLLEKMEPFHSGGGTIKTVSFHPENKWLSISWNDLPWKFEPGTPNISGAVGLAAAIRYLKRIGLPNVLTHEQALTKHAISKMREHEDVRIIGPLRTSGRCGIIPFTVEGVSPHDLSLYLDTYGIMIRSGLHCAHPLHQKFKLRSSARVSFYIYNTRQEINHFIEVLRKLKDKNETR